MLKFPVIITKTRVATTIITAILGIHIIIITPRENQKP
jgi:hypothetical protein